jgi:hypothetical protein
MRTIIAKGFDSGEITQIKRYFSTVFDNVTVTTKDEPTDSSDDAYVAAANGASTATSLHPPSQPRLRNSSRKLDVAAADAEFNRLIRLKVKEVNKLHFECDMQKKPRLLKQTFNHFGHELWIIGLRKPVSRYPLLCMNRRGQLVGMSLNVLQAIFNGTITLNTAPSP